MTKVTNKREQGSALNSVALRMTPIAAGCAILLATASGSTFAQIAPAAKDAPVDTIVVTGIRRGIEAAISVKQNNSSIVEAISAPVTRIVDAHGCSIDRGERLRTEPKGWRSPVRSGPKAMVDQDTGWEVLVEPFASARIAGGEKGFEMGQKTGVGGVQHGQSPWVGSRSGLG